MKNTQDLSLNKSHAAGRSQNSRLAWTAFLIMFYMPLSAGLVLLTVVLTPGWILFKDGQLLDVAALRTFVDIFAIDLSGMAGLIAFSGLILAINRIEATPHFSDDAESAMRHFRVLRFRNTLQWAAILGTATGPAGAAFWIILHVGEPGWSRTAFSLAMASAALWTILLLSVPSDGYFGVKSVAKAWTLNHAAFRRDMLVRHWGQLGGTDIRSTPTKRLPMWNTTWRWLVTAALLTGETALLSILIDVEPLGWNQSEFALTLLVVFVLIAYVGWFVMALSAVIVVFGIKATNQGWFKIGIALKLTALLLGPGLSVVLSASQYMPIAVMIWSLAVIQFVFSLGLLIGRPLKSWVWFPVRGLVEYTQATAHKEAHNRWKTLDVRLERGLDELPRREAKHKRKEISEWRERLEFSEI